MIPSFRKHWNRVFQRPARSRGRTVRRSTAAAFEQLEEKALLSAVAVFDNGSYVDTFGSTSSESDNVQATIASLGHTVSTFTSTTAAGISSALSGTDVVVIPELERGDLNAALSPSARTALACFVFNGGGLIIHGDAGGNDAEDLMNGVFGFSVSPGSGGFSSSLTADAAGTQFQGGAATLPHNNGTYTWNTASLPAGGSPFMKTPLPRAWH